MLSLQRSARDNNHISANMPCRRKSLRKARLIVKKFALAHGFGSDAEDIALATQEALKNIIQHACPLDNTMRFVCTVLDNRIIINVHDRGEGFNVEAAKGEPASPLALHGRGIQIIKGLMDNVRITSDKSGTVVHMEKVREG